MPVVYHGTNRPFATAMMGTPQAGTIDVGRGGGELGMGCYTQDSAAKAARRGQSIYGPAAAILRLTIDDGEYHAFRFLRLTHKAVQKRNAKLSGPSRATWSTRHDVMVGPLAYQARHEQQKFQTTLARTLLNGVQTLRVVI